VKTVVIDLRENVLPEENTITFQQVEATGLKPESCAKINQNFFAEATKIIPRLEKKLGTDSTSVNVFTGYSTAAGVACVLVSTRCSFTGALLKFQLITLCRLGTGLTQQSSSRLAPQKLGIKSLLVNVCQM
jgi:hypothetical protein